MQYRVVKEQSKWRRWLIWLSIAGVCIVFGGAGGFWGISTAESQIRENASLRDQVARLSAEAGRLRSQLTDSELVIDTQNHTTVALRDELTELHKNKATLETELGFFRKIMVPGETESGIHVERMNIAANGDSKFTIEATLIQVAERPRIVSGSVSFAIEGVSAGESVNLASTELEGTPQTLNFRFRYFQEIEQVVELPAEFQPSRIKVAVIGKNTAPIETEFTWPA